MEYDKVLYYLLVLKEMINHYKNKNDSVESLFKKKCLNIF